MKFKLVEKFDETRSMVQEYMYDAMDELNNASLAEYIQWFKSELTYYDDEVEQAVTDAYIEACDYGMIKSVEKTRLTSELKEYIESHTDIIDDIDELLKQCPEHLQHELKIVLSKLDESLNESLFDDAHYWNSPYDKAVFKYINENPDLVDDIETLYHRCSKYLKPSLVKILDHAGVVDSLSVKRAQYLLKTYDPLVLMNVIRDKDNTFGGNNVFDALEYGVNHWEDLFSDIILNESLNEELLTEVTKRTLQDFARSLKPKLTGNLKAVVNTKTACVDLVDGETIVAQVYPSFEQKEKTYKTLIRIQDKDDILPSDEIYVKREKTGNKNVISGVGQVKRVSGVYNSIEDAFN